MAQVIWQHLGGDGWHVESAGSNPAGFVHPLALKALEEVNLPIDGLESKSVHQFMDQSIDLAVTVCDRAQQTCPTLPYVASVQHWPFDDPADARGSEAEQFLEFRRVRDEITQRLSAYLESVTVADSNRETTADVDNQDSL